MPGEKERFRFIILDDEPINRLIATEAISKIVKDAAIKEFNDGIEALEYMLQSVAEMPLTERGIVLLDLHMPQLSGFEFLSQYSELRHLLNQRFLIFVISATADETDIQHATAHPYVAGVFSKPLTEEKLHLILQAVAFSKKA